MPDKENDRRQGGGQQGGGQGSQTGGGQQGGKAGSQAAVSKADRPVKTAERNRAFLIRCRDFILGTILKQPVQGTGRGSSCIVSSMPAQTSRAFRLVNRRKAMGFEL
jgi:hypothetical protein